MAIQKIKEGIYFVGAKDFDRYLFDELIPLPDGTSYNAYIVKGSEKTALVDTVDPRKSETLISNLKTLSLNTIDYIIAHHAEQDHSGTIPQVLELYPQAKIICTPKCKDFLMDLLLVPAEKFITVQDNETVSLGDRRLRFIHAPWVHWPETMLTYIEEDKILFSCDFLGSHIASSSLFVDDECIAYESAKRYYAEIMMPFRAHIVKHLERLNSLEIGLIAPSHGYLYDKPDFILSAYKEWVSDNVKNEVVIVYVSMHHSTQRMVDHLVDRFIEKGLGVKPFNLSVADLGKIAISLVDAASVIVATPTVLTGAHPLALYATAILNALRPKVRFVSIVGSFGWGTRCVEQLQSLLPNIKAEIIPPVLVKGYPKESDFKVLDELVEKFYLKHKEAGLVN